MINPILIHQSKTSKSIVRDPNKTEQRFRNSKITFTNPLIETFIYQSSEGINVSKKVKRGKRSFARLNSLRVRLKAWERWIKRFYDKDILEVTSEEIISIYNRLEEGKILKDNGEPYKSVADYSTDIKTFWHWYQKYIKKTENKIIDDITEDLLVDKSQKPNFHYFDFEQFKLMSNNADYKYKVLMWFLFDSGIRAPKELSNVKVSDISQDKEGMIFLNIRPETSKTFGRKIKLPLCGQLIKEWITTQKLEYNNFLFDINPIIVNRYLNRLAYNTLKIGEKYPVKEGNRIIYRYKNGLTMYDFRHISACYYLSKYKNESNLKYRFGWRKTRMIEYYTEFLGLKDNISDDDIIDLELKNKLERELEIQKQKNERLEANMSNELAKARKDMNIQLELMRREMFEKMAEINQQKINNMVEKYKNVTFTDEQLKEYSQRKRSDPNIPIIRKILKSPDKRIVMLRTDEHDGLSDDEIIEKYLEQVKKHEEDKSQ